MIDLLGLVGFTAACVGLWLVHPPLALIVGGALMMLLSIRLAKTSLKKKEDDE